MELNSCTDSADDWTLSIAYAQLFFCTKMLAKQVELVWLDGSALKFDYCAIKSRFIHLKASKVSM